MTKIVHVSDFYLPRLGGIELAVADLARRQRAMGHEVRILTSSPGEPEDGLTRLVSGRWQHVFHPAATRRGLAVLLAGDVDVVHAHLGVASPLGFFLVRAAARHGIPTVVTVHSLWIGVRPLMTVLDAWGGWSRLPIVWTAVSDAAARPAGRILGGRRAVTVIPNGIDHGDWRGASAAGAPGQKSEGVVVVAAVMRLSGRKRPMALVRALRSAQHLLGAGRRLHLVLVGDGPWRGLLSAYLRLHRMTTDVTFAGRLDRPGVARTLAAADVFIAPATRESFGIAALEARCAGLPVIAMSSGGVREFVSHGVEGLLCDDDEQLSRALARIAEDTDLRTRIREHNLAVDTPVAWAGVLAMTEAAYAAAMAEQHDPVSQVDVA